MDLSDEETKLIQAGLWEALRLVRSGQPGSMRAVETMFSLALAQDRALVPILRSYAEDTDNPKD
jgi:hypothetical protein